MSNGRNPCGGDDDRTRPLGRGTWFRGGALDEPFVVDAILRWCYDAGSPNRPTVLVHVSRRQYLEIIPDLAGVRQRLEKACRRWHPQIRVLIEPEDGVTPGPLISVLADPSPGWAPTVAGGRPTAFPGTTDLPTFDDDRPKDDDNRFAGEDGDKPPTASPLRGEDVATRQLRPEPHGGSCLVLEHLGARVAIPVNGLVLGRAAAPPGRIRDRKLSRDHCRIATAPSGALTCTDLRSRNGTDRNGVRITATTLLHAGDVLTLGDTTITVVRASAPGNRS